MGLKQELIATVIGAATAEEVVKAHLHERRRRKVGGDMSPHALPRIESLEHHGSGVPAKEVFQPPFHAGLPGIAGL